MKKLLISLLVLSLAISVTLPYTVSAFAGANSTALGNASIRPLGNNETTIRYEASIGFYLAQEIPQGLEFIILGEGNFDLMIDDLTGNYYLVEGVVHQSGRLRSVTQSIVPFTSGSSGGTFQNPTGTIFTTVNGRLISGQWWGGIIPIGGANVNNVASATIARTNQSQSRASVTTGPGGGANQTSLWRDVNIRASASSLSGITGNRANWDLR